MFSSDWNDFVAHIPWAVGVGDSFKVVTESKPASEELFSPTNAFCETFPTLTKLLRIARVTEVEIKSVAYQLFGWTDVEGHSFGWQCMPPSIATHTGFLHGDHALLSACFGGIKERWNERESWLLNLNSALCAGDARPGFNGWESHYVEMCKKHGMAQTVDPTMFTAFAFETNRNCTAYHRTTGDILLFAHDHCFDHVEPLAGCPEYTLYRIKDCPSFRTWVEAMAEQWLNWVR